MSLEMRRLRSDPVEVIRLCTTLKASIFKTFSHCAAPVGRSSVNITAPPIPANTSSLEGWLTSGTG